MNEAPLAPSGLTRTIAARRLFDSATTVTNSNPNRLQLAEYYEMIAKDPTARAGLKASLLSFAALYGDYQHEDPDIQNTVQSSFEKMSGSFGEAVLSMGMYSALGCSVIPLEIKAEDGQWLLDRFLPLDLTRTAFQGKQGDIEAVQYRSNLKTETLEYRRCLHLVHDDFLTPERSPWGLPECRTAHAAYLAKKAMLGHSLQVGQVQATKNLHAKVKEEVVPVLDEKGEPTGEVRPRQDIVREALEMLADTGILITGLNDEVTALDVASDPDFFEWFIGLLERMQLMAFLVPETTLNVGRGGLGNVTMSEQHSKIFEQFTQAKVNYVRPRFIDQIIKPLVIFNHGPQDNYGSFVNGKERLENAIEIVKAIGDAIVKNAVPAIWIPAAQQRVAELLGFSVDLDEVLNAASAAATPPDYNDEPVDDAA